MPSARVINFSGFLACILLLAYAIIYLEKIAGLDPCPLCMFQRVAFVALGIVFLLAALHSPNGWGKKIYAILVLICAGLGAALSARHIWLQNLPPDQVPECAPDLDYMLEVFPFQEMLTTVLSSSGECAEISWQFLGLSIPAWTLVCFVLLGLIGIIGNWSRR